MIGPPQNKRKSKKYSCEIDILWVLDDMEVDTSEEISYWATTKLAERKSLVEELDQDGPVIF